MKVELFYMFPHARPDIYAPLAEKFGESISKFSAGHEFSHKMLDGLTPGKDIADYIAAARRSRADLMICLGSHVRINRNDWVQRIAQVWKDYGPGLFGPFGSNEPIRHLRTTAFWCAPDLLQSYPWPVENDQDRYNFELHPERSITAFANDHGLRVGQVTGDCTYTGKFRVERPEPPSDFLMLDRFTDMIDAARA